MPTCSTNSCIQPLENRIKFEQKSTKNTDDGNALIHLNVTTGESMESTLGKVQVDQNERAPMKELPTEIWSYIFSIKGTCFPTLRCTCQLFKQVLPSPPENWTSYPQPEFSSFNTFMDYLHQLPSENTPNCVFIANGEHHIDISADCKYLFDKNGAHTVENGKDCNYVHLRRSVTLIGESREECILVGGLNICHFYGAMDVHVEIKDLTIQKSIKCGILVTGTTFYKKETDDYDHSTIPSLVLDNVFVDQSGTYGVRLENDVPTRQVLLKSTNVIANSEIKNSAYSGVSLVRETMILRGKSLVHQNCVDSHNYFGLEVDEISILCIIAPLTKQSVSSDNHLGDNWGGGGAIETMRSLKKVKKDRKFDSKEGWLHVKPGKHSLSTALIEAIVHGQVKVIFLEAGIHDEENDLDRKRLSRLVSINIPVTIDYAKRLSRLVSINVAVKIIGAGRDKCVVMGGLDIRGSRGNDVVIKNLTIRGSKTVGVRARNGSSIVLNNVSVHECWGCGMLLENVLRNELVNTEISGCLLSGLRLLSNSICTLSGNSTTIHHNCTKRFTGRRFNYGVRIGYKSTVNIVSPLLQENISTHNGGLQEVERLSKYSWCPERTEVQEVESETRTNLGNWGGDGSIENIKTSRYSPPIDIEDQPEQKTSPSKKEKGVLINKFPRYVYFKNKKTVAHKKQPAVPRELRATVDSMYVYNFSH